MSYLRPAARIAILLPAVALLGCNLLTPFDRARDGGPDTGADAAYGDVDDHDGAPEADAETEADVEAEADLDQPPTEIEAIFAHPRAPGPYSAGSSVLIELAPVWSEGPAAGIEVHLSASGGGLLALPTEPAHLTTLTVRTEEDGDLPTIRLTFPLEPWPYLVDLAWETDGGGPRPVEEMPSYQVEDPLYSDVDVIGGESGESIRLPHGLQAAVYAPVEEAFSFPDFDERDDRLMSLVFSWTGSGSEMVISSQHETCFFGPSLVDPDCHQTTPEFPREDGPDRMSVVVFFPDEPSAGLYGVSWNWGDSAAGGLYRLGRDGSTDPLVTMTNTRALAAVPYENRFRPSDGAGIYWFAQGTMRFFDPGEGMDLRVCPEYGAYPHSIVVADPDIYEEYLYYIVRLDNDYSLHRVHATCVDEDVAEFGRMPTVLRGSPGTVFGRMIYAVSLEGLSLLVPGIAGIVDLERVMTPGWSSYLIDMGLQPVLEGSGHHPPGLYILDGAWRDGARVLHIYQDLSDG